MFKSSKVENFHILHQNIENSEIKYRFYEDGKGICTTCGNKVPAKKISRMSHDSKTSMVFPDEYYNHGKKRGQTVIVSGDRPNFAVICLQKQDRLDPDMVKFGDCRVRIGWKGTEKYLDLADRIFTVFYEDRTEYQIELNQENTLKITYTVFQISEIGAGGVLSITNTDNVATDLTITFQYSGIYTINRTTSAKYFDLTEVTDVTQFACIHKNIAVLQHSEYPQKLTVSTIPQSIPTIKDKCLEFDFRLHLEPGENTAVTINAVLSEKSENTTIPLTGYQAVECLKESKEYYAELYAGVEMSTPNKLLDEGFKTALINFDYIYSEPAWLEGIHWWTAYWANNYQISAATALQMYEKAAKAIAFFSAPEEGPCAATYSSGNPQVTEVLNTDDGLPYYLFEIIQYYQATGDLDTIRPIWEKIVASCNLLLDRRDAKGTGLLGWHMGCNAFLYQADHLQLPGEAVSPSIMMSNNIEGLAKIAADLGNPSLSNEWTEKSKKMMAEICKKLWNKEAGVFYSHIDMENDAHMAHYYTDMVFPVLYADLPPIYKWQSLQYLSRTLLEKNLFGEQNLMRVGNYKPDIFGNNNVMPVQMSETALAYLKSGDSQLGVALLESVALASTIYTEAPGNFPERMSDSGKGEANYGFGNPIAAYLNTIIYGLFGITVTEKGKTLNLTPCLPDDWNFANFSLPEVQLHYTQTENKSHIEKEFSFQSKKQKEFCFSLYLPPCKNIRVTLNGEEVPYIQDWGIMKTRLTVSGDLAADNKLKIEYQPIWLEVKYAPTISKGEDLVISANQEISNAVDANQAFDSIHVDGERAFAKAAKISGEATIYLYCKMSKVVYPVQISILKAVNLDLNQLTYDYKSGQAEITYRIKTAYPSENYNLELRFLNVVKTVAIEKVSDKTDTISFELLSKLPESTYQVSATVYHNGEFLFTQMQQLQLQPKAPEELKQLIAFRDCCTKTIDLHQYFNSKVINGMSRWRCDVPMIYPVEKISQHMLETPYGRFDFPTDSGNYMVLLDKGYSDCAYGQPKKSDGIHKIRIPIEEKAYSIALFYASEVESRHTFSEVGKITLYYQQKREEIPLIVGKNIDSLFSHFASDTLEVKEPAEVWTGNSWDVDSMNLYRIACDPYQELQSLEIEIDRYDVAFGLMAMNVTVNREENASGSK